MKSRAASQSAPTPQVQGPEGASPDGGARVGSPEWAAQMQGVMGNAAMRAFQQFSAKPDDAADTGMSGPAGPLPHRDALRASFGDAVDTVPFYGGTPSAIWACAAMGTQAFVRGGAIIAASAAPPLEIIAHELVHILQRTGEGAVTGVASGGSDAEREASDQGRAAANGQPVSVSASAAGGDIHRWPGPFDIPWDVPVPDLLGGLLEELIEDAVEAVVDTAISVVSEAVEDAQEAVVDFVTGIGEGIAGAAESAANAVGDALNIRENEDILDFEEDMAAGDVSSPVGVTATVLDIVRRKRAAESIPVAEMSAARAAVAAVSNEDFRQLLKALDKAGLLLEVSQLLLGGTPAAGESDMFEVPVASWRFWNASDDISADMQRANTIYEPHNIHIEALGSRVISKTQVQTIVGHDVPNTFGLDRSKTDGTFTDTDMVSVVDSLGVGAIISGLWVPSVVNDSGADLSGTSMHTENMTHGANIAFVATDYSGPDTFAHELGHILTREGHFAADDNNLMRSGSHRDKDATGDDRLTDEQIENIRGDVLGYLRS